MSDPVVYLFPTTKILTCCSARWQG